MRMTATIKLGLPMASGLLSASVRKAVARAGSDCRSGRIGAEAAPPGGLARGAANRTEAVTRARQIGLIP